jgi:hypothetical protein
MLPVHGDYCDDFPEPTEPAEFSPFFGKYASTGSSTTGQYYGPSGTTTTPDQKYDPRFYEQAPLDQPKTPAPPEQVAPPEAPAPGNGNGNGNGNGKGNGGDGTAAPG